MTLLIMPLSPPSVVAVKGRKGVQRLKEWLWRPSRDLKLLQSRQDAITFFTDPSNQGLVKEVCLSFYTIPMYRDC